MPFNADTYRANRHARDAWGYLAQARALRDRIRAGDAYAWEVELLPSYVENARFWMTAAVRWRRDLGAKKPRRSLKPPEPK